MSFTKTTEQDSNYNHLEKMSISELLSNINNEDKNVPQAVEKALPQIEALVSIIVSKLKNDFLSKNWFLGEVSGLEID